MGSVDRRQLGKAQHILHDLAALAEDALEELESGFLGNKDDVAVIVPVIGILAISCSSYGHWDPSVFNFEFTSDASKVVQF